MSGPFRIGFVCVSHPHCAGRIRAVRALAEMEIAAVFDPNVELAREVAGEFDAPHFESLDDLLTNERIDLVVIEGTNAQNAEHALRCAKMRKPILLEKPGAQNASRLGDVRDAITDAGVFCQVGYHLRYSPSVTKVKALLNAGTLGRITTGRFHAAVMQPWLTSEWFCDPNDRGGMVFNDFCHMLDLLISSLGSPTSHTSRIVKLKGLPSHAYEDSAVFTLEFGDTLLAGDCCGWEVNDWISTWDLQLFGTLGTLIMNIHPPAWRLYASGSWTNWSDEAYDGDLNYRHEMLDVASRVRRGEQPGGCTIDAAVDVLKVIEEMYAANGL